MAVKDKPASPRVTHDDLVHMGQQLTDKRVESARVFSALAPALGVDVDLDVMEAEYQAALAEFVKDAR